MKIILPSTEKLLLILLILFPVILTGQQIPGSLLSDLSWGLYTTSLDTAFNPAALENNDKQGAYLFGGWGFSSEGMTESEIEPFEIGWYDSLAPLPWSLYIRGRINHDGEQKEDTTAFPESGLETITILSAGTEENYLWNNERKKIVYSGTRPFSSDWTAGFIINPKSAKKNLRTGLFGHYSLNYGNTDIEKHFSSNVNHYTSFFYNNAAAGEVPEILPIFHIVQDWNEPLYRHNFNFTIPIAFSVDTKDYNFNLYGSILVDNRDFNYSRSWIPVDVQQPETFTAREESVEDRVINYSGGLGYNYRKKLYISDNFTSRLMFHFSGQFEHFLARNRNICIISQDYSAQPTSAGQETWASFRHEIEDLQSGPHQFGGKGEISVSIPLFYNFRGIFNTSISPEIILSGETAPQDEELITKWTRTVREDFTGDADFGDDADIVSTYITTHLPDGSNQNSSLSVRAELPLSIKIAPFRIDTGITDMNPLEFIFSIKGWGEYKYDFLTYSKKTEKKEMLITNGSGAEIQSETSTSEIPSPSQSSRNGNWSFGWDYRLGCRILLGNGNSLDLQLNTEDLFEFESLTFSGTIMLY